MGKVATLILKHFQVVTILVGLILVVGGAAGGWRFSQINLPIDSAVWRYSIGLFGTALIIAAVYIHWEESRRLSTKPRTSAPKDFKPEPYPVEIITPKNGAEVEVPFEVTGRCEKPLPPGYEL